MHRSPHYVSAFALVLGFSFVAGCGQKKIANYASSDGNIKVAVCEPHGCEADYIHSRLLVEVIVDGMSKAH